MTEYDEGTSRKTDTNPFAYHNIKDGTIMIREDICIAIIGAVIVATIAATVLAAALMLVWR